MLDTYSKTKEDIINNLIKLEKVATSEHTKIVTKSLQEKLGADIFSIVVIGQFKRGKTTFINAILGKDLLPTAIIPLTSIITILKYGEQLSITVFLKNETKKEIKLKDLFLYITEKHNPENEKKVDKVEITYPSQYLKNGVRIIDTPGIASVHSHNTKTTYEYLPHADVAIFLMSVDPPITEAELNFLDKIKKLVVQTFFIQNKIDTISEIDCKESLSFSKEIIEERAGFNNIKIYPLSAKNALEGKNTNNLEKIKKSGLMPFENALEEFLINQKGKALFNSVTQKINNLIEEEMLLIEIKKKSLNIPLEDLKIKMKKFKIFIKDIDQERIDSIRLLTEEIRVLQKETVEKNLEKLKKEKIIWLIAEVEKFAVKHRTNKNNNFIELVDEFIDIEIKNLFNSWRIEEERNLKIQLNEILKRFTNRMNKILDDIIHSTSKLFGVSYRQFRIRETLPAEIEFRFKIIDQSDVLGMTIDLVKRTLPKVLAHRLIIKKAKERIRILIDRHCGKTRYDFSKRLEKLVLDYSLTINEITESSLTDVLNALETSITLKDKTSTEIAIQEINLDSKTKILKEIEQSLQKITI